jgi:hypothetical protein
MRQILALQVNLRSTQIFAQTSRMSQRRGPPDIRPQQPLILSHEHRIVYGFDIRGFQFLQGRH